MRWMLRGGTVVDPASNASSRADVLIEDGRIAAVGTRLGVDDASCAVEDVTGCIVAPGFVDMHVHLREPGGEHKETIATGSRAAARGGFVAICAMPNTRPTADDPSVIAFVRSRAAEVSPIRVLPIACITRGQRGQEITDMQELVSAGAVAFSDDGHCVMNARVMRQALEVSRDLHVPLLLHEQDEELDAGGHAHAGATALARSLQGMPSVSECIMVARDLLLAESLHARIHINHISTAQSVQMVREAKARGVQVTAEVTPHHLLLTEAHITGLDPNFKMNPPLRTEADRQALLQGLTDGTIDAIATDHAPHTPSEKDVGFARAPFGVIGLETSVQMLFVPLMEEASIPLHRIVDAFSTAPSRILGLDLGVIAPGRPACLTVVDPRIEETVDVDAFESRSRNCPFAGQKTRGLPVMTVVDGRIVMKHRRVLENIWL